MVPYIVVFLLFAVQAVVSPSVTVAAAVSEVSYTLTLINHPIHGPIDIANNGDLLVERQLESGAPPVPLLIKTNGQETAPFQCAGTSNDTAGYGVNNLRAIVGTCNGITPIGFVVEESGAVTLLKYPGAITTWGLDINDNGRVVGFYANPITGPICCNLPPKHLHSYMWDKATGQYATIDNPLAEAVGGWTMLTGINNGGQIVGHYNTIKNVPWEEYQFLYDNGTFTPIAFPGADQTHIEGFNNNSQLIGWYDKFGSDCSMCVFLFDDGHYFTVTLPLPANAPRPDGIPSGNAFLGRVGGLNDNGQFVGTYYRIAEWGPDPFYPGQITPTKYDIGNFVATPAQPEPRAAPNPPAPPAPPTDPEPLAGPANPPPPVVEDPPLPPAEPEQPIYAAKDQAKIQAAQTKLDVANEWLEAAEQSGDPKQITKAAKALASAQKNLNKAIQTAEKNLAKALAKAAKAAEKAAKDEAKRLARG